MQSYKLLYCEYWKLILTIILFPLLLIAPLIIVLISIKDLSDTILFISVFGWMAIMILLMIFILYRQVYATVNITIGAKGLDVGMVQKNLFNRFNSLHIPFSNIKYVTDDEDVNYNNRKFYTIRLRTPSKKIILMPFKTASPADLKKLSDEMHDAITTFNELNVSAPHKITEGSFYAGPLAKVFTYIVAASMLLLTIAKIVNPATVEWYRLIWMYAICFGWIANYIAARKRAKAKAQNL